MKLSSKNQLKLDFWLVALSFLIAIGLSIVLLNYEKWLLEPGIRDQEVREIVGQTTNLKNTPKRRYAGSLSYFDLKKGENIHLGDTLFVDGTSNLEFKLTSGSILRLGAMTLVLIDRENNEIKIILNNGNVAGVVAENEKLTFDFNEESLEVQGSKDSEFKILKSDLSQSSISGTKGKVKLRYHEQEYDITDTNFNLKDPASMGPSKLPPLLQKPQTAVLPTAQTPLVNETVSLDDVPLDLPVPFPPNKQLYLIKKTATIMVMPKRLCAETCQIHLLKENQMKGTWTFEKQKPPLLKFMITERDSGQYSVKFKDGTESQTEFEIQPFSPQTFEKAIQSGISVELLD